MRRRCGGQVFQFLNWLTLLLATWCVGAPQLLLLPTPTPTKGNTTAAPLLRGRPPSGPASTAFEVLSRLGLLRVPWALSPTRFGLFVATKPHTSGGLAALRVPVGEGDSRWFLGFQ
jgi:hypothetical protein